MRVVTAPYFENRIKRNSTSHTKKKEEIGMRPIDEREKILNMHFIEKNRRRKSVPKQESRLAQ